MMWIYANEISFSFTNRIIDLSGVYFRTDNPLSLYTEKRKTMGDLKEKTRVQTFIDSLEEQNVYVLETEWSNDSFVVKIDLSYLSELDRMDSEAERRKQIDKDRVLYKDAQFIIQHPYGKTYASEITVEQAKHWIPQPLKDVLEIKIIDKAILKACKKRYEDNWLPCDGACGDPEHLEFREVEVYSGWIYDGQNLLFTDSKQELSALVRKALEEIPKIVESVS